MEQPYFELGSFTILINDEYLDFLNTPDDETAISDFIREYLTKRFQKSVQLQNVFISTILIRRGCLILEVILGALAFPTIYTFIKDYDKLKANLKDIIKDFKNAYLNVSKSKSESGSQTIIELVKEIPDEIKPYYDKGNNIIKISDSKIVTRCVKTALMRDDVTEVVIEEKVEKTTKFQINSLNKLD